MDRILIQNLRIEDGKLLYQPGTRIKAKVAHKTPVHGEAPCEQKIEFIIDIDQPISQEKVLQEIQYALRRCKKCYVLLPKERIEIQIFNDKDYRHEPAPTAPLNGGRKVYSLDDPNEGE